MAELAAAVASALWLGVLTSISPCPLATNIAAVALVSKRVGSPLRVLVSGLAYTLGRVLSYATLGVLLVSSLLASPHVSSLLQRHMNQILGPLLVLVGMLLCDLIRPGSGRGWGLLERGQRHLEAWGLVGTLLLGALFALSFCPLSAALFFGSLVPIALQQQSGLLLPACYGVGTGLPVLAFAVLVSLGMRQLARSFETLRRFEPHARRATGIVFILVGIYLTLVHIHGLGR